jgi:hypothetical protein
LKVTRLHQSGLLVLHGIPVCPHAVATTPVRSLGTNRSWDGLFQPFPGSPATTAFPGFRAGRLSHWSFRGLLSVHSRYGLLTRRTAQRYVCLEGSDGFVTSAAAPIASGGSDPVSRVGLAPTGNSCLFTTHLKPNLQESG